MRKVLSPAAVRYFIDSGVRVGFERQGKGTSRFSLPCYDPSIYHIQERLARGETFFMQGTDLENYIVDVQECIRIAEEYEKENRLKPNDCIAEEVYRYRTQARTAPDRTTRQQENYSASKPATSRRRVIQRGGE
jgi:hypothetical protein